MESAEPTQRPVKKVALYVALSLGVPALLLGAYFGVFRGDELARVAVVDEPVEMPFSVGSDPSVEFWAELEVTPPFAFDTDYASVSGLPHVLDYLITVEHDGQVIAELLCNPFNVHFFDWEASRSPHDDIWDGSRSRVSYLGRIEGCAFDALVDAQLTIRVQRRWNDVAWQQYVSQTELVVRGPSLF